MRKEFMLSFANIRKTKGHTVSLFILFLIASLLLNAGLLVFLNFGNYFNEETKALNTSDMYFVMPSRFYTPKVDQFIKSNNVIKELQKNDSVEADGSIPYNGDKRDCTFLFNDADTSRNLSKWKFVGEHLDPDSMSIYVPYVLSVDGGYKLNDKLMVTFKNTKLTFTIKGFTDDVFFSSLDTGALGIYLPHQAYETVKQKLGSQCGVSIIFANVSNTNNNIESGIKEILKQEHLLSAADSDNTIFGIGLPLIKLSRTFMASGVSAMMVAFAAVIVIVCLIVIRFRIGNSIEDDMLKIGSLKAIGYTSGQIITSIVLQFSLIALAGGAAGIVFSYFTTPALSNVLAHQSGLLWVQGFDGRISSIALCSILLVVALVSLWTARRIHKLNPIVALRGGIVTHNFKKNYFPLHKAKGSLPFLFALKSMLQNKKSSIMIAAILTFVAFASAFAVIMFYNTAVDTTTFAQTPGSEVSNAAVFLKPTADQTKLVKEIKAMNGVRKVQFLDEVKGSVENSSCDLYYMDNYSAKETDTVYDGRYPRHDNEITISGVLSDALNKKIGDTVTLKVGDKQAAYLITGLAQGSQDGGTMVFITSSGMAKLDSNFKQQELQIYLNKGVKSAQFVKDVDHKYGQSFLQTVDMDKEWQQGMSEYTTIISKVGIAVFAITILVVILVLYFVINSSIVRQKRELGIQKAIGFTTLQLMNQVSLGFLPPVIVGVILGSILGITQTNAMMSFVQHSMGIMKANYIVTPGWIILFSTAIVIVSYITSMLITYRIRRISAYALVSE